MKRRLLVFGLSLLLWACEQDSSAQRDPVPPAPQPIPHLTPPTALDRSTVPGRRDPFQLTLQAGQGLYLRVDQQGVDLAVALTGPAGKTITVDEPPGPYGPEELWFRAAQTGTHTLVVHAGGRMAGHYHLHVETHPSLTPRFAARLKAFNAGKTLTQTKAEPSDWEALVSLWQQAEHPRQTAVALYHLADARAATNREQAVATLEAAWFLAREHNEAAWAAAVGYRLAYHYRHLGRAEQAAAQFDTLRDLAKINHMPWWEAFTVKQIAVADLHRSQHVRALTHFKEAATLFERIGDPKQVASVHTWLAQTLTLIGRLKDADDALDRAETYYRQQGRNKDLGAVYLLRGWLQMRRGKVEGAESTMKKALALKGDGAKPEEVAGIYDRLGTFYREQQYWAEAEAAYRHALKLLEPTNRTDYKAVISTNLARAYADQGRFEAVDLSQPLADFTELGDQDGLMEVHAILADQARAHNQPHQELAHLEAALEALDKARGSEPNPDTATPYIADRFDLITTARDRLFALDAQYPERDYRQRAFALIERVRARTLREHLADKPDTARHESHSLQRAINRLELQRLQAQQNGDTTRVQNLGAALRTKLLDLSLVDFPEQTVPATDLAGIRKELLHPNRRLLVYALSQSQAYVLVVGPEQIISRALPPPDEINTTVARLMNAVTGHNPVQAKLLGTKLGDMLLGPVAEDIAGKELLLVKDIGLYPLPFALLRLPGRDRYLIQDHGISELPSASVGVALKRRAAAAPAPSIPLAVFADPVYPQAAEKRLFAVGQAFGPAVFRALPWSAREAEQVAALAPDSQVFLRHQASRGQLERLGGRRFGVLHFAVHGLLHEEEQLAGLVLSLEDAQGYESPGFLRLHQLERLHLPAGLVVLSACRTARGKTWLGEGPIGPGRAFLKAGADRVLTTTWPVHDGQATVTLMTHFYRALLQDRLPAAQALQRAQVAMIEQGAAPYLWAGYLLTGPPE